VPCEVSAVKFGASSLMRNISCLLGGWFGQAGFVDCRFRSLV
jgi:hypothetical protein